MRSVIQRVTRASVAVDGEVVGNIGEGLLVLLGVKVGDTEKDADYMADKLLKLRIFEDENGNLPVSYTHRRQRFVCQPVYAAGRRARAESPRLYPGGGARAR